MSDQLMAHQRSAPKAEPDKQSTAEETNRLLGVIVEELRRIEVDLKNIKTTIENKK